MKIPLPLERIFVRRHFGRIRSVFVGKNFQKISQRERIRQRGVVLYHKSQLINNKSQKNTLKNSSISLSEGQNISAKTQKSSVPSKSALKFSWPTLPRFHSTLPSLPKFPKQKITKRVKTSAITSLIVIGVLTLSVMFGPQLYFRFFTHEVVPVKATEEGSPLGGKFVQAAPEPKVAQPVYDAALPEGNWLIIPRIGVRTEIQETQSSEEALVKGVWMVPEFGKPGELDLPIILAAHRFGYKWWWNGDYWKYHSFYLLPDLQPGDLVEVIADHRKYLYEIYAGEEGTEISDYDADMILYTCKFLSSDIRHFRYARIIDPGKYQDYDKKLTESTASGSAIVQAK